MDKEEASLLTRRRLRPDWLWLPVALATLWLAGWLYLPLLAPALAPAARWLIALALVAGTGLSLAAHGMAHIWAARRLGVEPPARLALGLLGDPAQQWPATPRPAHDALIALSGPVASLAIAAVAGLAWWAQLTPALDAAALFVALFNAGLAALNLAPGYPFDGGRVVLAALQGTIGRPERAGVAAGVLLAVGLLGWAVAVAATQSRLSAETSAVVVVLDALLIMGLARHPAARAPDPAPPARRRALRRAAAVLLGLALLCVPLALLPVPYGLFAPGGAVSVAPMVDTPAFPRTPTRGALLLTTIIEQTPIAVAQWLVGQADPAITLMPPERLLPPDRSPQALVAASADQLAESQATATLVALRLAGYPAALTGDGARVLTLGNEGPAGAGLRPGDRIVALAGATVHTVADLLASLGGRDARERVAAVVVRGGQRLQLQLPLLAPAQAGGPPRLGVTVETADLSVASAVAVSLHPQGIIGGPSAGLMFALAIYDRLTPGDLTGGWRIAGTGTVAQDGQVGPIGGVAQKVAAAERAGAEIFLVPRENAADALRAAQRIRIITVGSAAEALAALQRLAPRGAPRQPAQLRLY